MDQEQAKTLLEKFRSGKLTEQERALLESWYLDWKADDNHELTEAEIADELQQIRAAIPYLVHQPRVVRLWPRIAAAAASILLILSAGGYFLLNKQKPHTTQNQVAQNDLLPGSNKAILTLSNGKQINLTDAKAGIVAQDANIIVKKNKNGSISYVSNPASTAGRSPAYQTITTPRGGQWPVIELPDGSSAILDAESSITYPLAFNGGQRKVTVTGQVYFEVKHDPANPFMVNVRGETIEDIGTHFNVNAYEDEPALKTTLIEGSVRIRKNGNSAVLQPGQQAVNIPGSDQITIKDADLPEVTAWKNGLFHFYPGRCQNRHAADRPLV